MWMLLLASQALVAAAPALTTDRFGQVFPETTPVRVAVAGGGSVLLRDLDGREVARRDATATASADFGLLAPGYYEAVCGESVLPLVVVIDPAQRPRVDSRLATDHAQCWLVDPAHHAEVAELLRLCGFGWVRERLSWGEVEKQRGQLTWGKYETSLAALAAQGLKVYQVFHASPGWSRADKDGKAAPDDLRDIYRFAQALAKQFKGRVLGWEVWNEPDISFFRDPASECAAFQKAAFLGFRSVDPTQLVLGPSMAMGAGPFPDHLLANGTGHYLDVWNYHIYDRPEQYERRHAGYRELLAKHGCAVPSWVTEAGDRVNGPDGLLTRESRIHQAAFISRAFAQALAAGIDRHFWFIFPFYREGSTGWGLFETDERAPFPGVAAMSTVTWALGRGDFLGRLPLADPAARAFAFARGDGSAALVVWREADQPAGVELPLDWRQVTATVNHLGTPQAKGTGRVSVTVARAAQYLVLPEAALPATLGRPAAPPPVRPAPPPGLPAVVVRLRPTAGTPVDKGTDSWLAQAAAPVALEAQVYNFGDASLTGDLVLTAPDGWILAPARQAVSVAPGERAVAVLTVTPTGTLSRGLVQLVAAAGGRESAPAQIYLTLDPQTRPVRETMNLPAGEPAAWVRNIAGGGTQESAPGPEGGVRFTFAFPAAGDNWAYPSVRFDPPLDLSRYDALRFEYRTSVADAGQVRLMLVEQGGGTFFTSAGLPGSTTWRQATVTMADLPELKMGDLDGDGKLDLSRIGTFRFGANCKPLSLTLELRNVQAVRF